MVRPLAGQYSIRNLTTGIGLEVHERQYLRGGSDVINNGHKFSNEPGVYIEGKAGLLSVHSKSLMLLKYR
jgi:Xaa-Pro aminopeptidase